MKNKRNVKRNYSNRPTGGKSKSRFEPDDSSEKPLEFIDDDDDESEEESEVNEKEVFYNKESDEEDDDDDDDDEDDHDINNLIENLPTKLRQKILMGDVNNQDSDDEDDENSLIDDDESENEDNITNERWGKKSTYWSGDTADLEIGQDIEDAEDEEKAALEQVSKRLHHMQETDFFDDSYDPKSTTINNNNKSKVNGKSSTSTYKEVAIISDTDKALVNIESLALGKKNKKVQIEKLHKENQQLTNDQKIIKLQSENPEVAGLLEDMNTKLSELNTKITPIWDLINQNQELRDEIKDDIVDYLDVKQQLLLSYCMNITFYMYLKTQGQSVKSHPVMKQLLELRYIIEKMRPIDQKLQHPIDRLLKLSSTTNTTNTMNMTQKEKINGKHTTLEDKDISLLFKHATLKPNLKAMLQQTDDDSDEEIDEDDDDEEEEFDDDDMEDDDDNDMENDMDEDDNGNKAKRNKYIGRKFKPGDNYDSDNNDEGDDSSMSEIEDDMEDNPDEYMYNSSKSGKNNTKEIQKNKESTHSKKGKGHTPSDDDDDEDEDEEGDDSMSEIEDDLENDNNQHKKHHQQQGKKKKANKYSDDDDDEEEKDDSNNKLYRPPKMMAAHFQDRERAEEKRHEKLLQKKKRLMNTELMDSLRDEFGVTPETSASGGVSANMIEKQLQEEENERKRFEEDRFVRLTLSRKDKQSIRKRKAEAQSLHNIDDIGDIGDLDDIIQNTVGGSGSGMSGVFTRESTSVSAGGGDNGSGEKRNDKLTMQQSVKALTQLNMKRSKRTIGDDNGYDDSDDNDNDGDHDISCDNEHSNNNSSNTHRRKAPDSRMISNDDDNDDNNNGDRDDTNNLLDEFISKKKAYLKKKQDHYTTEPVYSGIEDTLHNETDKRGVSYEIMKNKGVTPYRKSINRNPRVKKRKAYEKAVIARKGQVRQIITGTAGSYGGESTGIKSNVSRSRKL